MSDCAFSPYPGSAKDRESLLMSTQFANILVCQALVPV
ncbi:MAG: hypothetical protein ACI9JD_005107 [Rhodococcus sp. (in: high G+C Gram-positive bacteria)]|jgi:hypothetical protein